MLQVAEEEPLQPALYGNVAYFYKKHNPAFTEILVGPRLFNITAEWTGKVYESYMTRLISRKHADDEHPGLMESSTRAEVFIGGYEGDRWIGQITVAVPYAVADEFGRHSPAPGQNNSIYEGSGDLRGALYEHLPRI
ncbi:hypothetical protein [Mycobacterium sp. AZCC_0083]|uniref:hypothetical protein n=1 Tax=Mycobacterium sp. AZCC_0083 TaxID=2735882 RepID=UPI001622C8F9|nr:hypothetical protein [Mycobacterium sp. AZCC_0083]MBB5167207.1 hypothetical protein [Mycobacterium sp. AZCC_0083]